MGSIDVSPLSSGREIWQIETAKEVYTNRDVPLYVVITMGDGEQYRYQVVDNDYVE